MALITYNTILFYTLLLLLACVLLLVALILRKEKWVEVMAIVVPFLYVAFSSLARQMR